MKGSIAEKLHPRVRRAAEELGYTVLLPVQEKAIPVILSGSHTLIVAPTGSGKTEAALFPVLSLMWRLKEEGKLGGGVKTVYITPLRALNRDIVTRMRRLVESSGFSIEVRHGDTGQRLRRKFLEEPPDVAVTTPETLNLLLAATRDRSVWDSVRWVIVDEVHELLDSERGSELAVAIERLARRSRHRIQRIGLSATLSRKSIAEASRLIAGNRRVEVVVDESLKEYDIRVSIVDEGEDYWGRAVERLAEIIRSERGSVLVFVNTRATAEKLAKELAGILGEDSVRVHHGSLARGVREEAERLFREGKVKVLVATSSMELGIDIGHVDLVVQFMSPRQVIAMTQRAGRAGHRLDRKSRAVIVTPGNLFEVMESAVIAFRASRGHLEDLKPHVKPLDALAHQLVALVVEGSASTLTEAAEILMSTQPFSTLSLEEIEEVAMHLDGVGVLRYNPETGELRQGRRSRSYLYRVSMIPDEVDYKVIDMVTGERVGDVSEKFIEYHALRAEDKSKGLRFILAGRLWEAVEIDHEEAKVIVKPIAETDVLVPLWQGELIPVSYKVAREVCALLSLAMEDPETARGVLEARGVPGGWIDRIIGIAVETAKVWGGPHLSPTTPVIEDYGDYVVLYTCLGSRGNFALAVLLSALIEATSGLKPSFETIPYAIVMEYRSPWLGEIVAKALIEARSYTPPERAARTLDALRRSTAYMLRFLQVAKRMGVFDPDARVPSELLRRAARAYSGTVVERETLREMMHEKLDLEAVNSFLAEMRDPIVVKPPRPTPLAEEVFRNPYMRGRDVAVDLKVIAIEKLAKSKKARLENRKALLLCLKCGGAWEVTVKSMPEGPLYCKSCKSGLIAPLPSTEWGRQVLETYKKHLRGARLTREEKKLVSEAKDRALLYLTYAMQGMGKLVTEALMARGVGPSRARRILEAYIRGGEEAFYSEIIRAEEEYIATRKFWDNKRQ